LQDELDAKASAEIAKLEGRSLTEAVVSSASNQNLSLRDRLRRVPKPTPISAIALNKTKPPQPPQQRAVFGTAPQRPPQQQQQQQSFTFGAANNANAPPFPIQQQQQQQSYIPQTLDFADEVEDQLNDSDDIFNAVQSYQ
jgi:hypothetical protein